MHMERFFQNAYITRDIDRAMAVLQARHGFGDFVQFEPRMDVFLAGHGVGPAHLKAALAWKGRLQVELIQPISGHVHHYLDYLPSDPSDAASRLHHICMRVDDYDAERARAEREGWPVAYEGGVEGCRFFYVDARDSLGHYLEYMWMSDGMWSGAGGPAGV